MDNYNAVDETTMESVQADAAQAPDAGAEALSAALAAATETEPEQTQEETGAQVEEANKGLRGRMLSYEQRGYKRGQQEAEAKWAEEKRGYEERLARYAERELQDEAKQLATEKNMPEDIALEYLRMKRGLPAAEHEPQQRDSAGRFSAAQSAADDTTAQRAKTLMDQAESFERMSDGSVSKDAILEAFQNDEEIRRAVASGEMDFIDVGKRLAGGEKHAPRVIRDANNGGIARRSFANMSDEEFRKFDERVRHGAVFDARR